MTTARPVAVRPNAGTKGVARADREAQILEVACRRFGESGFAGTSVADVAEAAGISKPLIYNYFGSKDGLYLACLQEAGDVVVAEIERTAASGKVGLERAVVTLEGIFTALDDRRWMWRLFFDPTVPDSPEVQGLMVGYRGRMAVLGDEGVTEMLAHAGNTDALDKSALLEVWAAVFESLVAWWVEHPDESPEQMTQRCVRLFTTALLPPG